MMLYDVLKASKGLYVDDEYAMLWGKQLGGWTASTLTGTLPMTFRSNGTALIDYRIYGTADGAGVQTENVCTAPTAQTKTNGALSVTTDGQGRYIISISSTTSEQVEVSFDLPEFTIPASVGQGGNGTFSMFNTIKNGTYIVFYYNETQIEYWVLSPANRQTNSYISMGNKQCNRIVFRIVGTAYQGTAECAIMFTNDGILPASYIPYGYKLQMQVKQRTKNLLDITGYNRKYYGIRWYEDNGRLKGSGTYNDSAAHSWPRLYAELSAGTYTLSGSPNYEQTGIRLMIGTCTDDQGSDFSSLGYDEGSGYTFTLQTGSWVSVRIFTAARLYQQTVDLTLPLMIRKSDTTSYFEPYYNIKQADIYIGDTKLGAEDYIDYESGKIVRDGTPQDPPLPLPELETFKGTNTLDSTVEVGEVTITGKIKEAE